MGLYNVRTTPKFSPKKYTPTVEEMQQLPHLEKTDSQEGISCLKWTIDIGKKKYVYTSRLMQNNWLLSYCYWNKIYLKDYENDLRLTEIQSLVVQPVYLMTYFDFFQTMHSTEWNNCPFSKQTSSGMDVVLLMGIFRLHPGLKLAFENNSARKTLYLIACFCWNARLCLREIDWKFNFGGTIGYGDSYLEFSFCHSKVIELHAILHDATGAMRSRSGKSPGYCYMIGRGLISSSLGCVTGLLICLYVKLFLLSTFNSVHFTSSMSCFVLEIELAEITVIKELEIYNLWTFRGFHFVEKITNHKAINLLHKKPGRTRVKKRMFGLQSA